LDSVRELPALNARGLASATYPTPVMSTSTPIHVGIEGQRTTANPTRTRWTPKTSSPASQIV